MISRFLITALLVLTAGAASAEPIKLKRGLPTDIWLSWPDGAGFDDPKYTEIFPEYRLIYDGTEFPGVKKAGFDFVRLTIDPAVFLWKRSPERTAQLIKGMRVAIDEIRAAGLKVIVDLHSMPRNGGAQGTEQILANDQAFSEFLEVVGDVGRALVELPADEVTFEPLNEPMIDCFYDMKEGEKLRWPTMLLKLHAAGRKAAPKHTLILSGACWGGADGLTQIDPKTIKDNNVIWSFHNYEPFVFTHQGASWASGHEKFIEGLRFPAVPKQKRSTMARSSKLISASDASAEIKKEWSNNARNDLNAYFDGNWSVDRAVEPFKKVEAWAKKHNIPGEQILLGEFGATRFEKDTREKLKDRYGWYRLIRSEAEKRGYAWSTWSWSGGMGLTTTYENRVFEPEMLKALGLKK
jgi:endoglucanase